jgi:uncharacterized protein DUF6932
VLTLDDRKMLPPGVHDATLKEVEDLFGRFQRSDRRPRLFRKLRDYFDELEKAELAESVIIDGSFVMACVDEPEDVDLIVILPANWDWNADLKPYQYNLVSKRRVKQSFGLDMFLVPGGSQTQSKWVEFFSAVNVKWCELFGWPDDTSKGLVRVVI